MGSRFLNGESIVRISALQDGTFNLNVATINGFIPSGLKYSGASNSAIVTNTAGINGGSIVPLTFSGSDSWTSNEIKDGATYQIRQTGIINIADQGLGSDGNLDLRIFLFQGLYAPSMTVSAVSYSGVFPLTSSTNKRWMLETQITRRGSSIIATSKFEYMPNSTTTFEGALFAGNPLNLDFTQPIKLDIRAYPTAGSINIICQTMSVIKL